MRVAFALAAAALAAAPAAAQPGYDRPLDEREIRQSLPSPAELQGMAAALDQMMGALLTLDIGPVIDAADPMRRNPEYGRPGRTLRELGRRDDPYFEQRMRAGVHGSTAAVGQMIGAFATIAPVLQRSLEDLSRSMEGAMRNVPRGPGPGYDYEYEADDRDDRGDD